MHKALLIDGDEGGRRAFVRDAGPDWWVDTASSLEGGVRQLRDCDDYDLVVMDLGMSGVAGLEGLHRLAEYCAGVPILVLTGDTDPVVQLRALREGATDCIWRGVDRKWVRASLNRALEWSSIEERLRRCGVGVGRGDAN